MAYDEALAENLRTLLLPQGVDVEVKMFGAVCFMHRGNMVCGADKGRYLFRVGKENSAAALARPGATPMAMAGRVSQGFVWVDAGQCDRRQLKAWVDIALGFVATLPAKSPAKRK
ncbi:MAG: TfoX/Sxy family protein [Bauldia sp.]|nr:TfoX/Sxy family protein [Bauldia sp.]